jgi:hypothetical protein
MAFPRRRVVGRALHVPSGSAQWLPHPDIWGVLTTSRLEGSTRQRLAAIAGQRLIAAAVLARRGR